MMYIYLVLMCLGNVLIAGDFKGSRSQYGSSEHREGQQQSGKRLRYDFDAMRREARNMQQYNARRHDAPTVYRDAEEERAPKRSRGQFDLQSLPYNQRFIYAVQLHRPIDELKSYMEHDPTILRKVHRLEDKGLNYPLHIAVSHGLEEVVRLFLNPSEFGLPNVMPADPNIIDDAQLSPLAWTLLTKRDYEIPQPSIIRMMEYLLNAGANLECTQDSGSLLHIAARKNYDHVIAFLLDKGLCVDIRDSKGNTPLHVAASIGALDAARILIQRGACVNAANEGFSDTPLHFAITFKRYDIAALLLSSGADQLLVNYHGNRPIDRAISKNDPTSVQLLIKERPSSFYNKKRETLMHSVAYSGYVDLMKVLKPYYCDINAQDDRGNTPLHLAALSNKTSMVDYLLHIGADASIMNTYKQRPIDLAIKRHDEDIIRMLQGR